MDESLSLHEPPTPTPLLHTVGEAAELLRVSRSSVYTLISSGQLPSLKVGGRRLVARSAIVEFIGQQQATA